MAIVPSRESVLPRGWGRGGGVGEGQLYSWYHAHTHNIPTFVFLP